jgi:CheY-like chemotaxis protein
VAHSMLASKHMQSTEAPTIAFVEDDPEIVEMLSVLLQDMGYSVAPCAPGPHTYHRIVQSQPQLVILDVRMGHVDGIDIFLQMRADPTMGGIPVIFFTATEQRVASRIPQYREMGASFVTKPSIGQLSERIEQLLPPRV